MNTILNNKLNCLFIAPTGWGKTTMLINLVGQSQKSWVYLSPLRALCDEFYSRSSHIEGSFCPRSKSELRKITSEPYKLLVLTPEICIDDLLFEKNIIWVLDEFHLFYYWGESFRKKLSEVYLVLHHLESTLLLLSATVDREVMQFWRTFSVNSICINLGNHKTKTLPASRFYFFDSYLTELELFKSNYTTLVFFKYRSQVNLAESYLSGLGYKVVSCLGGESHHFNEKIKKMPEVDFILGTSSLSHGVNLPKISYVIITYRLSNFDMWIQMTGRAGRRGESFKLVTKNFYRLTRLQFIKKLLLSIINRIKLKIQSFLNECRRYYYSQDSL